MKHFKINRNFVYLGLIFLLGLFFRFVYLLQFSKSPLFWIPIGPDVSEYYEWARQIVAGQFLWKDIPIHAPLYPMFLATLLYLSDMSLFFTRLLQLLFCMFPLFPLYFLLQSIHRNKNGKIQNTYSLIPVLMIFIWSTFPALMYYQAEFISEALLLPLLTFVIIFLYYAEEHLRRHGNRRIVLDYFLLAGISIGLASITHPATLFFFIGEVAYLGYVWKKREKGNSIRGAGLAIFILSTIFVIAPVSAYNSYLAKHFVLIQKNSGFNWYLGNNFNATGTCYLRPGHDWDRLHEEAAKEAAQKQITTDTLFLRRGIQFIKEEPLLWLSLQCRKLFYVWNYRDLISGTDAKTIRYATAIQRDNWWFFGVFAVVSILGVVLAVKKRLYRYRYRHFFILLLSFWAVQILFVTSGRYRLAMYPAIFMFSSFGFVMGINYLKKRKLLKTMSLTLLAAICVVFLFPVPQNLQLEQAEADAYYGMAFLKQNNLQMAEIFINRTLKALPTWGRSYDLAGELFFREKRWQEAQIMFLQSIKYNPNSYTGYMNLGNIHSILDNRGSAEYYYNKSLECAPNNPEVLYNYGEFLLRIKHLKKARFIFQKCLSVEPGNRKALNSLGVLEMMSFNTKKGIYYFQEALALDPNNPNFMLNVAAALASDSRYEDAVRMLNKALAINPKFSPALRLKKLILQDHHK